MAKTSVEKVTSGGWLSGYKTYITCFIGVITAIAGYLTGELSLTDMFQTAWPLIAVVFLRKGVADSTK